jgi:general secretion pathway protein G
VQTGKMQDKIQLEGLGSRLSIAGFAAHAGAHLHSKPHRKPSQDESSTADRKPRCPSEKWNSRSGSPDLGHFLSRGFARAVRLERRYDSPRGFTLVELLIVLAVLMTITALAVPNLVAAIESARVAHAVGDIRAMESEIALYESQNNYQLPNTLADIGRDTLLDPWGTPYQYLNFANAKGKGAMRKDRFLVPLNSTYDLYSMGKDRKSVSPITAKESQDDILRANDGGFLGLASQY